MEKDEIANCLERAQRIKYLEKSLIKFYIPLYDTFRTLEDHYQDLFEQYFKVRYHNQYKHRYLAKPETRKLFEPMLTKEILGPGRNDDMLKKELDVVFQALEKDIKEYQAEYDMLIKYNKEKCAKN